VTKDADKLHDQEAIDREVTTLRVRLDWLKPYEAEAKELRRRLKELGG
jgi:hypothetical protein